MVNLFVHRRIFIFEDYLDMALRLASVSLDSTVLISMFAGFKMWSIFFYIFCCCYAIFAGFNCFDFHIRWIQLS